MKAAVFQGAGRIDVVDVPIPEVGPREVLVKVHYCGICGSDLEAYHTGMYEPGMIIGHEFAGEVAGVGERAGTWAKGDRVTANDAIPCGHCPGCRRNRPVLCSELSMPGITRDGGMAEYVAVPGGALHRLPEGVSIRKGALAEPLAVALHGVERSALTPGDPVLIMGAGTIGLLVLQCARIAGAGRIYVSEVNPACALLAERLGASAVFSPHEHNLAVELFSRTGEEGPAVIYVCTGAVSALEEAVTLVAKGGQILVLGLAVEPFPADFMTVVLHELDIRGSYLGYDRLEFALELVAQGKVDVESLVTHEIQLEDVVDKGFEVLNDPQSPAVKILIKLI